MKALFLVAVVAAAGAGVLILADHAEAVCTAGNDASSFRYRCKDSDGNGPASAPSIAFNPVTLTAPVQVPGTAGSGGLAPGQYSTVCVPFGFTFTYYGAPQTCGFVHASGFLSFSTLATPAQSYNPVAIPTAGPPDYMIAGYWQPMMGEQCNAEIDYETVGTSPTKTFVVQFKQVLAARMVGGVPTSTCNQPDSLEVTFQIHLKETTNNIEVHLTSVNAVGSEVGAPEQSATLGIENSDGSLGYLYSFSDTEQYQSHSIRYFPNHAPVATPDTFTVNEDSGVNVLSVMANDVDIDGDGFTITALTSPATGVVSAITGNTQVAYTPAANFCGEETFTYKLSDSWHQGAAGTVTVSVQCANDKPQFTPGSNIQVNEDAGLVTLAGWGFDVFPGPVGASKEGPGEQVLTFQITNPEPSLFSVQPTMSLQSATSTLADMTFEVKPHRCIQAPITLSIVLKDDGGTPGVPADDQAASPKTVTLDVKCVNDRPTFVAPPPQSGQSAYVLSFPKGSSGTKSIPSFASQGKPGPVEATDEAGQAITYHFLPGYSTAIFQQEPIMGQNGNLIFGLKATACGFSELQLVLRDDGGTANGGFDESIPYTFRIAVDCDIDAVDDVRYVKKNSIENAIDPTLNDQPSGFATLDAWTNPPMGTLTPGSGNTLLYTPPPGMSSGSTTFSYSVRDYLDQVDSAMVTIYVVEKDLHAVDDAYTTLEDEALVVPVGRGLQSNDLNLLGPGTSTVIKDPKLGTVQVASDGSFTYKPKKDAHGTDSFTYALAAGSQVSNTATVIMEVKPVNDPPAAFDDIYLVRPNKVTAVAADVGVHANDKDADGDAFNAQIVQLPIMGGVTLNGDGSFSYQPKAGFTGVDSFRYRNLDAVSAGPDALVTIDVQPNKAPIADFTTARRVVSAAVEVAFVDQSFDPDGSVVKWFWDFGDQSFSNDRNPVHRYPLEGEYTVRLVVQDADGVQAEKVQKILVTRDINAEEGGSHSDGPPIAVAGPDQHVLEGAAVVLDGTGGDGPRALSFQWRQVKGPTVTLVDGNKALARFQAPPIGELQTVEFAFSLIIFDGQRESVPDEVSIFVSDSPEDGPRVDAGPDKVVKEGSIVRLTATPVGFASGPLTYSWSQTAGLYAGVFGTERELEFVAPVFAGDGRITLLVEATQGSLTYNDTVVITVVPLTADAGFTADKGRGKLGGTVTFTPLRLGEATYLWDFGDGNTSTDPAPIHRYAKSGTYQVRLMVESAQGGTQEHLQEVRVFVPEQPPGQEAPGPAPLVLGALVLALVAARQGLRGRPPMRR